MAMIHVLFATQERMSEALSTLVATTANWSVEALRNELLVLNKLAFSVRYEADRTELMQVGEVYHSRPPQYHPELTRSRLILANRRPNCHTQKRAWGPVESFRSQGELSLFTESIQLQQSEYGLSSRLMIKPWLH